MYLRRMTREEERRGAEATAGRAVAGAMAPHARSRATIKLIRVAAAFGSVVLGWIAAIFAVFAFERLLVQGGGSSTGDLLVFVLFIGFYAGAAWVVSVLPLVLFVDHRRWIFRPMAAPAVGAGCGMVLLALEQWLFFDTPPWEVPADGIDFSEAYLFALAAVVGAVTWTAYAVWAGRRRHADASASANA
jgi:hypothetical protein